jgi:amyloid beta precursor protein binding protein 1
MTTLASLQLTARFLKELNPSVEGAACVDDVKQLLVTNPDFFLSYTLIIASSVEPEVEAAIADLLWKGTSIISA